MDEIKIKVETAGKIFNIKNERPPKVNCAITNAKGFKIMTVRLPAEMYRRLCEIANTEEVPVSVIIRRALDEHFKQYE